MKMDTGKRSLVKHGKWVALALLVVGASCVQVLDGAYEYEAMCTKDTDCDDKNPCTVDECLPDSSCEHTPVASDFVPGQIAGDCKRNECKDGALVETNDDADIPDDSESCTTDTCASGAPVLTPVPDGTMCSIADVTGSCQAGKCSVQCGPTNPCNDSNPCTEDTCNAGTGMCTFAPLDGLPTPGFSEPVGDCKLHICSGGADTVVNDDSDILDDMNGCTDNLCTAGVPSNPPSAPGSSCGMGMSGVCDGLGACGGCLVPSDCVNLPPDDECQQRACINNMCVQNFAPKDQPVSMQQAGDCQRIVCDGTGGLTVIEDNLDVPIDNNPCTQDICTTGVPSNPNEPEGFSCGSPLVCNGMGGCVTCNTAADCTMLPPDDFCKKRACTKNVCELVLTPAGTDLPTVFQTSQDCKVVECDAVGNFVTAVDTADKPVDNNQCTQDLCSMTGNPSNPNEPVNTACSQNGGTLCNGAGACKKANGAACAGGTDCLSTFCVDGVCCNQSCGASCKSCNVAGSVGTCVNVPKASEDLPGCTGANSCDGNGVCKKDDGQGCAAGTDCVSTFCTDGVCCGTACAAACRSCNIMGSVGVCSNITSGEDNVPTNACAGANACDASGTCKLKDGQTCTMASQCVSGQCFDGVCCNVACSATCKSCNLTGTVGVCSNIATGQDDANGVPACMGANQSCDGMGTCKKEVGQTCAASAECLSGFCVDGVCCSSACSTTCRSCNVSGSVGTCTNIPLGQDDVGTCSGSTQSCDGAGACKSEIGQACVLSINCLSGFCVDGVCCNSSCSGNCQACTSAKTGAPSGACGPVLAGTDPDSECSDMGAMTCGSNGFCNGAGSCQLYTMGTVCAAQSCTGSIQTNADICNGTGMCISGGTTSCLPYVCGATACKTACSVNADCVMGHYCDGTICVPSKADGTSCAASLECASGFCVDGVCCNTACTETCRACNVAGTIGTCSNLSQYVDDDNAVVTCNGLNTCNGAGACLKDNGQVCMMNGECASNNCNNGNNTCAP